MKEAVRIQQDNFSQDEEIAALKGSSKRMAALEACRWRIDALKQRVPVWK